MIEESYYYQRHRLRSSCGYSEKEIDSIDVTLGIIELDWLHDRDMEEKINMFSSHGIDVQDIKKMGTSYYRDYIMRKKNGNRKDDTPEDMELFKGGFDSILEEKRGIDNG